MSVTANRAAKALRLIDEGRCHVLAVVPGKVWTGVVVGDTGRYLVTSVDADAMYSLNLGTGPAAPYSSCSCDAFRHGALCSHVEAALRLRVRSTPVDELFAAVGA